jgi:hypothetical protein
MNTTRITRYLLTAVLIVAFSAVGSAQVFLSVNFGPPALPVYPQPVCPSAGYMWTPGYWAWGPYGYYWVPGTWVPAPQPGLLWTPGYWAYGGGLYYWHPGYWGPVVGFYGGIPYGYGYTGAGYYGGYWRENHFYYNQTVNNVAVTNVHNVYNQTVINNSTNVTRVSYNGGPGGIVAHPNPEQEAAAQQRHVEPTPLQIQHENAAKENPQLRASVNEGRPSIAATARAADFSGHGVVAATEAGAPYRAPESRATSANDAARPGNHARPEAEGSNARSPRNYVPRPPSSYQSGSSRVGTMPDAATPRPDKTPREENVPRPENAPRTEPSQPRETTTHPENAPRPSSGSRPQSGSPSQPAAQHEAAPHPQAAPRPESTPEGRHENPPQR